MQHDPASKGAQKPPDAPDVIPEDKRIKNRPEDILDQNMEHEPEECFQVFFQKIACHDQEKRNDPPDADAYDVIVKKILVLHKGVWKDHPDRGDKAEQIDPGYVSFSVSIIYWRVFALVHDL